MANEPVLLCRTENGLAFRCTCCGELEVQFGNAILHLDRAETTSLMELLDSFDVGDAPDDDCEAESPRRDFVVRTELDGAAFAFSAPEVRELRLLLGVAGRLLAEPAPAAGGTRPRFTF